MKSNTEYSRLKLDKKWKRNTKKNYIQFNNIAIKSVKLIITYYLQKLPE